MEISIDTLFKKMEEELMLAKTSATKETMREKIYSMKILCELILEEQQRGSFSPPRSAVSIPQQLPNSQHPATLVQPKKLEESEANGDSLFDF